MGLIVTILNVTPALPRTTPESKPDQGPPLSGSRLLTPPTPSTATGRVLPPSYIPLPPLSAATLGPLSASDGETPPSPFFQFFTAPNSPLVETPPVSFPGSVSASPPRELPSLHRTDAMIPNTPLVSTPPISAQIPGSSSSNAPIDGSLSPLEDELDPPVDEDALTPLERIYIFSQSKAPFRRIHIIHALPSRLEQITPQEAMEFVLPLLNPLAVDEDEQVQEALAAELIPIMWWFLTHAHVVSDGPVGLQLAADGVPILSVQTFTPILGTLLLSSNGTVRGAARYAVVHIICEIQKISAREADPLGNSDDDNLPYVGTFGPEERTLFEQELFQQIIIGMSKLDAQELEDDDDDDFHSLASFEDEAPAQPVHMRPLNDGDEYFPIIGPAASTLSLTRSSAAEIPSVAVVPSFAQMNSSTPAHYSPSSLSHSKIQSWPPAPMTLDQHDETDSEENTPAFGRLSSMSLIGAIAAAGSLPSDIENSFVEVVEIACSDPMYWVRREASFAIGALAKSVPERIINDFLLPLFGRLRQDHVWHVRHSSLFALPAILSRLPCETRREVALKAIIPLSTDEISSVRTGTLEALGEVIHTFHDTEAGPPSELVRLFLGRGGDKDIRSGQMNPLARVASGSVSGHTALESFFEDPARPLICAFNFPAVALTLGRDRWPEIRGVYLDLAANEGIKVRQTLAASLGEMAKIIGEENAKLDLLKVWWRYFQSSDVEVRGKAVECVVSFIKNIGGGQDAVDLVDGLVEAWEKGLLVSWRERNLLASYLLEFATLIGDLNPGVFRKLLLRALEDTVSAIRETTVALLPQLMSKFSDRHDVLSDIKSDISSFRDSGLYRRRMTFVACQQALCLPNSLTPGTNDLAAEAPSITPADGFWQMLLPLATDPVIGVRVCLSRFLGMFYDARTRLSDDVHLSTAFLDIVRPLAEDSRAEVRSYLPERLRYSALSQGSHVGRDPKPLFSGPSGRPPPTRSKQATKSLPTFSRPPGLYDPDLMNKMDSRTLGPDSVSTVQGALCGKHPTTHESASTSHASIVKEVDGVDVQGTVVDERKCTNASPPPATEVTPAEGRHVSFAMTDTSLS
ncbi:ARM repeat-containing protein [Fistulina hepatica ATCC 64428]|nr:ARM repeat-containing protein [Fistulina hepatica ATCC 64428]